MYECNIHSNPNISQMLISYQGENQSVLTPMLLEYWLNKHLLNQSEWNKNCLKKQKIVYKMLLNSLVLS